MAVPHDLQGHGIGARLVRAAFGMLAGEGARTLRVATAAVANTVRLRPETDERSS